MRWWILPLVSLLLGCPARKPGSDVIPLDSGASDVGGADSGDIGPKDGGEDGGVDAGDGGVDAGDAEPPSASSAFTISGGGASVRSPNYQLRMIVAPTGPVADEASASYRIRLGPGPVQHEQ